MVSIMVEHQGVCPMHGSFSRHFRAVDPPTPLLPMLLPTPLCLASLSARGGISYSLQHADGRPHESRRVPHFPHARRLCLGDGPSRVACTRCMHQMHAYYLYIGCMHQMHAYYLYISCMHQMQAYYLYIRCMHQMHAT